MVGKCEEAGMETLHALSFFREAVYVFFVSTQLISSGSA